MEEKKLTGFFFSQMIIDDGKYYKNQCKVSHFPPCCVYLFLLEIILKCKNIRLICCFVLIEFSV